jgi:hypothetical protein
MFFSGRVLVLALSVSCSLATFVHQGHHSSGHSSWLAEKRHHGAGHRGHGHNYGWHQHHPNETSSSEIPGNSTSGSEVPINGTTVLVTPTDDATVSDTPGSSTTVSDAPGKTTADQSIATGSTTNAGISDNSTGIVHPGLLHTAADFARVIEKVNAGAEPWISGWNKLQANNHAQADYQMRGPAEQVNRGFVEGLVQNYAILYYDTAAAYNLGLRWKISGNTTYADKAAEILDAWSATLKVIGGSVDQNLAAGIYGYQMANAGEILRDYEGWKGLSQMQDMMRTVFFPKNEWFLNTHVDRGWYHYRANWCVAIVTLCTFLFFVALRVCA